LLLLDDCKRFGTLAFAHAARSGFVATTLLKSFVDVGILTEERKLEFMRNITTVAGEFEKDKLQYSLGNLSLDDLLRLYGHLRPGTYDIGNQAYWENPERYFVTKNTEVLLSTPKFEFSKVELESIKKILIELGGIQTPNGMVDYLQQAIQMRESVKFEFTKNLSKALDLCVQLAEKLSLTRDEISFLEYNDLKKFKLNAVDPAGLKEIVNYNQKKFQVSQLVELPGIINKEIDFYCFERHFLQPNFVTLNKICANVELLNDNNLKSLTGSIVLIPQSDPGYDWLFGYKISGLITKFGGANSHMAIRAAEADLPAAIGVGEKFYEQITKMKLIELDCCNQVIREVL
jgi:phosphohistidine swiveling domain-containing protein